MSGAADLFALAFRHHQAGDLARAEQLYRQALQADAAHADAWCFLGAACQAQGRLAEAEAHYRRAAGLAPERPTPANCLGALLSQQGRLEEAADCFRRAAGLQPDAAEPRYHLGLVLARLGRTAEAVAQFQEALRLRPDYPEAHYHAGAGLELLGRPDEAVPHYRQALRLNPHHADAWLNLGKALAHAGQWAEAASCLQHAARGRPERADAHCHLGNALAELGRTDEAVASFEEALRRQPDYPLACYGLALARKKQGRLAEAAAAAHQALRLRPDFPEAQVCLANALVGLRQWDEAVPLFRQALTRRPDLVEARNNLGAILGAWGDLDGALACFDEVLRRAPDFAEAHLNRGLIWLLRGDWPRGWPDYEWRLLVPSVPRRDFPRPRWDGSAPAGRTLLLVAEQGLGDTLFFVRYALLLRRAGARVLVECQPPLVRLLADALGPEAVIAAGAPLPEHDAYAPLASLPGLLGTTPEAVPAEVPYLRADEGLVRHWRQELGPRRGPRVGIHWQGGPASQQRSVPLAVFEPLSRLPGVQLVSLQKGPGAEQLQAVAAAWPVLDLGGRLDEAPGAFRDTAALLHSLDLVVTADSAVAHLAGALGRPVWVALAYVPDWRWLLGRDDSPWYPTARLFRRRRPGDWDEVFARIAAAAKVELEEAGRS
jgi:tetratricopeptide (TPR) repeat protein